MNYTIIIYNYKFTVQICHSFADQNVFFNEPTASPSVFCRKNGWQLAASGDLFGQAFTGGTGDLQRKVDGAEPTSEDIGG